MEKVFKPGECVRIPDGRIGRIREKLPEGYRVRVQRNTSKTHQFLIFLNKDLEHVACPKGWMSVEGYNQYMKVTLKKMKERLEKKFKK